MADSPSTEKLCQARRLASTPVPCTVCRRFWQAGTLWQRVCFPSNPLLCVSFPPSPCVSGKRKSKTFSCRFLVYSFCSDPVSGGRAGVNLTRGAGGDTGGGVSMGGGGVYRVFRGPQIALSIPHIFPCAGFLYCLFDVYFPGLFSGARYTYIVFLGRVPRLFFR